MTSPISVSSVLRNMVPMSVFTHGGAGKVFSQAAKGEPVVVTKNNKPEAVVLSIAEFSRITDELENARMHEVFDKAAAEPSIPVKNLDEMMDIIDNA